MSTAAIHYGNLTFSTGLETAAAVLAIHMRAINTGNEVVRYVGDTRSGGGPGSYLTLGSGHSLAVTTDDYEHMSERVAYQMAAVETTGHPQVDGVVR